MLPRPGGRGRIDAVYWDARPDGASGYLLVDWKTNRSATADPLQLAIYRLAWAELHDIPPSSDRVRAAFYYVRSGGASSRRAWPIVRRWRRSSRLTQPGGHAPSRDPARAVGPDRARRRAVADQLHPRVGNRGGAVEMDAAAGAQVKGSEAADRRPEAGGPEDRVGLPERAVDQSHPVGLDPGEHRVSLARPSSGSRLLLPQRQPGHADYAGGWQAPAYALLDAARPPRDRGRG